MLSHQSACVDDGGTLLPLNTERGERLAYGTSGRMPDEPSPSDALHVLFSIGIYFFLRLLTQGTLQIREDKDTHQQ
jgi:hypothetical protein